MNDNLFMAFLKYEAFPNSRKVSNKFQTFLLPINKSRIGQFLGSSIHLLNEPRHEKTNVLVSDLVRHKQAVQLQKMAIGLKFRI